MELQIRSIKTKTGNTSIQVISRPNRKLKIEKHIGTGKTEEDIIKLKQKAQKYIQNKLQLQTLPLINDSKLHEMMKNVEIQGVYHHFIYDFLEHCYTLLGFSNIEKGLLKNLVLIRIIEPSSKLRAIYLLEKYFKISYSENQLYKRIKKFNNYKEQAEQAAVNFAKEYLSFDFSLVFYDVTTLYFESFKEDDFKKCGFSKDNKFNQPQIVIALIVDKQGFPISYEIFEGNKFEGHTFIPTILNFKKRNHIERLTIVADAAMLSKDNMDALNNIKLEYIVGARIGNLPLKTIKEISKQLNAQEGAITCINTIHGRLICNYSKKRARKDKSDRKKQLERAEIAVNAPSKNTKRLKFVKTVNKSKIELNKGLIEKAELLEGIKGYTTNINDLSLETIIARYKDLWKIEKAFRIAKHDLDARPIFHWKKQGIEGHLLIVFISLCITKHLELKTGMSIKVIKTLLWDIHDVELFDSINNSTIIKRTPLNEQVKSILDKLGLCY